MAEGESASARAEQAMGPGSERTERPKKEKKKTKTKVKRHAQAEREEEPAGDSSSPKRARGPSEVPQSAGAQGVPPVAEPAGPLAPEPPCGGHDDCAGPESWRPPEELAVRPGVGLIPLVAQSWR